ncbi:MAG: aldehyde dehydrogenase family protein [Chloroflexi bacterium]|nr:aldehyde dehydrogenase family protein [Chloroflexota bacterium]
MAEQQKYPNYIDGAWVPAASGAWFENRNPAHPGEVIGLFPQSAAADVDRAVAAAQAAFKGWSLTPAPRRAEILYRLAQLLVEHKARLARDMTREMGKILAETGGDVQEAIDMTFYAAGEGRRMSGQTVPSELPNKFAMSVRQPVGVCGLITPWNFPMAILSWKLMPALVCGNTVVIKPATDTPLSAWNLVQLCEAAGIPKGVVNLVTGSGKNVGDPLTRHPGVSLISFTGSTEIGLALSQVCAQHNKRLSLEMGGKNPIIVMEDANLDLALEGALWGGFGTSGQRCTAASRLIVHRQVYHPFLDRFVSRAKNLRVGNGLDPQTQMGPVINAAQLEKVLSYVEAGKQEGAELLCGGHRLVGKIGTGPDAYDEGFYIAPTVFADVNRRMRIACEEIFGPVVSVLPVDSLDEAIDIANDVEYGLSSAIYTQDVNRAFRAMRDLHTGIVYVNAPTIGAEIQLPFGGTKNTGNGHREAGEAALDVFSEWKAIYIDFSGALQRAQIDTHD